jgi:FdhD protein
VALEFNGLSYAVMMATPSDLADYATGFAMAEGLITHAAQMGEIGVAHLDIGWILRAQIDGLDAEKLSERVRARVAESSCGLCGMENLEVLAKPLPQVAPHDAITPAAIFEAGEELRDHQVLGRATSAAHAAAFCAPDGSILMTREDVGRHNALDKLIGALASADINVSAGFIILTARCSLELVQKAILANCPMLVTISAATDLAINIAQKSGLRLISLARADSALAAMPQNG